MGISRLTFNQEFAGSSPVTGTNYGKWPNGKALGLGPRHRRFDSCLPDHFMTDVVLVRPVLAHDAAAAGKYAAQHMRPPGPKSEMTQDDYDLIVA